MAKKVVESTDEAVKRALLTIATSETPLRLAGKGEHPPVFAKANKEAVAVLTDADRPLVVESGSGKAVSVALTAAGFELIAGALPEDKVGSVAKGLAAGLSLTDRIAFLQEIVRRTPPAAAELLPIIETAAAEEKAEADERAKHAAIQRQRDAATLEALEKWKAVIVSRKTGRIEALRRELAAEGAEPDAELPKKVTHKHEEAVAKPTPTSAEDTTFLRQVGRRLVSSWLETWDPNKPEARQFLEAAIWNVSEFKQLGEVGEQVSFDGRYHEGGAGLFTKSSAKVTRPGWSLQEGEGEYVLAKAQVVPA